ncbi:class I SAM-dependent methyltransferase [Candidatus Pacearchaeota archaeon]|nr:class I SAM-dependent methyltransferase [Candidatus Pacearchaeota archaeon]
MENDCIKTAEVWWKRSLQLNSNSGYYRSLYRSLRFRIKDPVLEIGGGAGTFLKYLGVDKATIVDIAGKENLAGNYKFIKKDITKRLNLKGKYKTIFLMEVLEHIKNPLYLMSQVYDLLDDDGFCYVAVPYTKLDPKRQKEKNSFNCHVSRWKMNEIIDQMRKLGFNTRVIQKRRRFKNSAFLLPHCWIVLKLTKRKNH